MIKKVKKMIKRIFNKYFGDLIINDRCTKFFIWLCSWVAKKITILSLKNRNMSYHNLLLTEKHAYVARGKFFIRKCFFCPALV